MTEPAGATLRLVQRLDLLPLHMLMLRDHHLADPLAILYGSGERFTKMTLISPR